jgi:hypothetical protein
MNRTLSTLFPVSVALVALLSGGGTAAADPSVTPVMSGLDNPRGLAFGPQGALYVAEAGRGDIGEGDGPCFGSGDSQVCYGATGAVSRLWQGQQTRVATGLPSYATATGRAQGPNDISMLGPGRADVTIGLETDPQLRDQVAKVDPEWAGFGRLVQVSAGGQWRFVADLGPFEEHANPDGRTIDIDPYGLLAIPGADLVADAGANDLVRGPAGERQ